MNVFDFKIITFINHFSQHYFLFDKIVSFLAGSHLLKGGVILTLIWWAWFKKSERQSHDRQHIVSTLLSSMIAALLSRVFEATLPFRPRPLGNESLNFLIPYGMEPTELHDWWKSWSSFPSDHASLFFALSTGLLFVSRKVGIFALAYTALLIALPRIYLGLHYPTDIIAGAIIGMTAALLGNIYFIRSKSLKSIMIWESSKPEFFYPVFFICTHQIVDMFADANSIIKAGYKLFQNVLG